MVASDQLFQLIKSLDKSEKGYFKKFASLHVIRGKNNYVKLFDAIGNQEKYDEEKLKIELSKEPFVKRLSSEKVYLSNLILKAMAAYRTGSSIELRLQNNLRQIDFLINKGLIRQAGKLLDKAIYIAKKYDKQLLFLELTSRRTTMLRSGKGSDLFRINKNIYEEQKNMIDCYRETMENNFIASEIFIHTERAGINVRDKKAQRGFLRKYELLLRKAKLHHGSFHAVRLSLFCHFIIYAVKENDKKAHYYIQKMVKHVEDNFHHTGEDPRVYSTALNNLAICEVGLKKYKEAGITLEKMYQWAYKQEHMRDFILSSAYNIELNMCLQSGQFERGIKLMHRMEKELANKRVNPPGKHLELSMYYLFGALCIIDEKYKTAARYLNKMVNNEDENIRNDMQSFARILRLIVYFELDDVQHLEFLVRSTYRYLSQRRELYKFEQLILEFIKRSRSKTRPQLMPEFIRLNNKMRGILKNPYEGKVMTYFNLTWWLESKIKRVSIKQLLAQKGYRG